MQNPLQEVSVETTPLGQSGFRLRFGSIILYIDPYLSNSVEENEGPEMRRLFPIWKPPQLITDADWVLITHIHRDHCDTDTLVPISRASAHCQFVGPKQVCNVLEAEGIPSTRLIPAVSGWLTLGKDLNVHPIVAAHPEIVIEPEGGSRYVGYIIEYRGRRIYHSGDTLLNSSLIDAVQAFGPIDVAILPVNECNYYRETSGIIGNMSVREAFQFAADLKVKTLVPMHWDMFAPNSVYQEEIETYYRLSKPPFRMLLNPKLI